MLVKIENGSVAAFPYSVGQLRKDNPRTSFPKNVPEQTLLAYGVHQVSVSVAPQIDDRTQKVAQNDAPSEVSGSWVLGWTVSPKTAQEISEYDSAAAEANRGKRNAMLSDCDWTQVSDTPLNATDKAAWASYRQLLRDITNNPKWPHLSESDWPTKP